MPDFAEAIAWHEAHEVPWSRDIRAVLEGGWFEPPPWNEVIGETAPRGGPAGMILVDGEVLARWGDTARVDVTFSVAKTFLALVAGLAWDRGMLELDRPLGFPEPQNAPITWRMLLQNTSEWEGTLWGKSDVIDRNRDLSSEGLNRLKGQPRPLKQPGTHWEYNDVRVNRLALSLAELWRRPLPEVLAEHIMGPIGASSTWRWRGYRNSVVEIDGRPVESVSGGSHWGGGLFISTEDLARVGELVRGDGGGLLSPEWLALMRQPCALNPSYGFLLWLNGAGRYPSAPRGSVFLLGAGGNIVWIDRERRLTAVVRWIDTARYDGFCARVLAALGG